jgi:predicted ferric reductase
VGEEGLVTLLGRGILWVGVYLFAVIAPLLLMVTGDPPPGRGWWTDFSLALGFVGMAMLGLQFAVTARLHPVDAPYGLDAVLQFHREVSFVAFGFVLAHPVLLLVERPGLLRAYDPLTASPMVRWGLVSIALLILLLVTSVWRRGLRLSYEVWRVSHGLLAVAIVATALIHIERSGYYVSGPWRRGVWMVMSAVLIGLLVWVRLVKPLLQLRRPYVVESVVQVARSTWALTVAADGHDGLSFLPGQFAWLRIGTHAFAVREHPFSISSSAEQLGRYEFTIKELGDFTDTIGRTEPGARVYVDGPYGAFSTERDQGPAFVLIAGGVGISPMMSMLRTLADQGDRRPVTLVYGSASPDEIIYRDELSELARSLDLRITHVLEQAPEGWDGEVGLIDEQVLSRTLPSDARRARFFICGPDAMMDGVEQALHELGIPRENINLERFEFV